MVHLDVTITVEAIETIIEIVNRGNNAVVKRNEHGVIVMEEKRKTKYNAKNVGDCFVYSQ